ncbi:hypothetical protein ACNZ70_001906 [Vibrio mimicus]
MIFDIKNEQKPLVKKILDVVENSHPLASGVGDVSFYVNVKQYKTTAHHLRFAAEQLIALGFVDVVERNLFITYEGKELSHRLAVQIL